MVIAEHFTPFFGKVEDVNDPEFLGRMKVRVYGYHTQNKAEIPTDFLQWFSPVISNSSSLSGSGISPTGYLPGSTVFGYFIDGESMQNGIVVGAIPSIRSDTGNDVSTLAIGEDHMIRDLKEQNRIKSVQGPMRKDSWSEPPYANAAEYPYNNVYQSNGGHVKEYDDTPGNERIHEYHRSGTYYEIDAQGNRVVKVVGDGYEIIAGDKYANIRGVCNLSIEGDVNWYVKGNWTTQIDGDKTEVVQGSVKEFYSDQDVEVTGKQTTQAGSSTTNANGYEVNAGKIDLNEG